MRNVFKLPNRYVDNILSIIKDKKFVDGGESAGYIAGPVKQLKSWPGHETYYNDDTAKIAKSFNGLITDMFRDNIHQITKEGTLQPFNTQIVHGIHAVKYDVGDYYGWHCDATDLGPRLSFTLALNDDYEGGNLEIDTPWGIVETELKTGEMVVYNTNWRHQVTPITKGQRLAVIGWLDVQSSDIESTVIIQKLSNIFTFFQELDGSDRIDDDLKKEIREQLLSLTEAHSYMVRKNRKY